MLPGPMRKTMIQIHAYLLVTALCCPILGATQEEVAHEPTAEVKSSPAPFIRLVEDGSWVRLQVAARSFSQHDSDGKRTGPRIDLCAAMHVGETGFYSGMQEQLDACDVVLFEGVGGHVIAVDEDGTAGEADRAAIRVTRRRMRQTAIALARFRKNHEHYPEDITKLDKAALPKRIRQLALMDSWNHALLYELHPPAEEGGEATFSLLSLGKDGEPGGEDADRDLSFKDQAPIQEQEIENNRGIQQDMAAALGLVFQLDVMNHLGPQWRNSDATAAELVGWLEGGEADQTALMSALDGSSLVADLIGNMLRLLSYSEAAQSMLRMVTIEVLARAEQVMQSKATGLGDLMEILLDRRNEIVLKDLHGILSQETPPARIGIIYGAAHQAAFQESLLKRDFRAVETIWRTAAQVNLDELGLPRTQVDWTRRALARSLDQMLK